MRHTSSLRAGFGSVISEAHHSNDSVRTAVARFSGLCRISSIGTCAESSSASSTGVKDGNQHVVGACDSLVVLRSFPVAFLVLLPGCVDRTSEASAEAWFEDVQTPSGWHLRGFAGDFDGDGLDDVIAGRRRDNTLGLFYGRADGEVPESADLVLRFSGVGIGVPPEIPFLSALGDLNGDGRMDLGAVQLGGEVVVVFGRPRHPEPELALPEPGSVRLEVETAVNVGDLDGDGFDELGVYRYGESADSRWFGLIRGRADWTGLDLDSALEGGIVIRGIDSTPHGVGDINGDGLGDLASSSPSAALQLHSGAALPWGTTLDVQLPADLGGVEAPADQSDDPDLPGIGVPPVGSHSLGDLNGDGVGDFSVIGPRGRPIAFVVFGSEQPLLRERAALGDGRGGFRIDGDFGTLIPVGDVNDDGVLDLLFGGVGRYVRGWAFHHPEAPPILSSNIQPLPMGSTTSPGQGVALPRPAGAFLYGEFASWGDYDGDGKRDLLIDYQAPAGEYQAQLLLAR